MLQQGSDAYTALDVRRMTGDPLRYLPLTFAMNNRCFQVMGIAMAIFVDLRGSYAHQLCSAVGSQCPLHPCYNKQWKLYLH